MKGGAWVQTAGPWIKEFTVFHDCSISPQISIFLLIGEWAIFCDKHKIHKWSRRATLGHDYQWESGRKCPQCLSKLPCQHHQSLTDVWIFWYSHAITWTELRRNQVALIPFTTKMAEVDRLSTSVSIRHTYFPPWLSWMLRIIRSPETLYKWRQPSERTFRRLIVRLWLLFLRYESHITLCTITSAGHWFSHFFRGQQQTWQMSSEQINLLAALQAPPAARPPPPTQRKQPPAQHRTQKANTFLLIGKTILIILELHRRKQESGWVKFPAERANIIIRSRGGHEEAQ